MYCTRQRATSTRFQYASAHDGSSWSLGNFFLVLLQPQSGYRFSVVKALLIYPLAILPLGAGLLLAYWYRARWVRLTYSPCPLSMATTVVMSVGERSSEKEPSLSCFSIQDSYGQQRVCRVQVATFPNVHNADDTIEITARTVRYLTHCRLRYLYSSDEEKFVLLR